MLERLLAWWRLLQPRERKMLGLGGGAAALALLFLLAIEPAWVGSRRLGAELPGLRSQLAQIESLAAEARQLAGRSAQAVDSPQQLKAQLEGSLKAGGLPDVTVTVAGELLDLRFKAVPFEAWLAWLDSALRETRLRAVDVALEREVAPGRVSGRLTLEAARRSN
jgi:general secretion pathway protein M